MIFEEQNSRAARLGFTGTHARAEAIKWPKLSSLSLLRCFCDSTAASMLAAVDQFGGHMSKAALLVIDAQESFRHRPYWTESHFPEFVESMQTLIDGARKRGVPVLRIFHAEPDGPFSLASGYVDTLAELTLAPEQTFHKSSHSALVGSGLDVWLIRHGIELRAMLRDHHKARLRYGLRRRLRDRSHAHIPHARSLRKGMDAGRNQAAN
jgi:hypothetical protein